MLFGGYCSFAGQDAFFALSLATAPLSDSKKHFAFCLMWRSLSKSGLLARRVTMSIWQYKVVEASSRRVYAVDRQPVQPLDPRQPQDSLPLLATVYLDELGADGWELVSYDADHEHGGMQTTLILKRPKL